MRIVNTAPETVAPVARDDPSAERLDKTAADRETETGAGTPAVLSLDTIEFVEDALEIGGRYSGPLIDDLDLDELPVALCADIDAAAGRGIFRGIIEQIEQHLLEQDRIQRAASASPARYRPRPGARPRTFPARCNAEPTISATSINSSFNSIAPDSSRVMSRRLATNRFKRSASSCKVREQLFALGRAVLLREAAQARDRAEDRGERRPQIVRDRGQERGAQPLGLGQHAGLVEPLGERNALDRHRRLVAKRVEQPPLIRRQQRPSRITVDPDHADRAAAGAQRQEQPLAAGQGVGAAPGRAIVLPGPARRCHIGVVELVLGRVARRNLEPVAVLYRHQQNRANIQHRRDLIGGRPQ